MPRIGGVVVVFGAAPRHAVDPRRLLQLVRVEVARAIQVAAGRHELRILQLSFQFGAHGQQLQMPLRTCRGMARDCNNSLSRLSLLNVLLCFGVWCFAAFRHSAQQCRQPRTARLRRSGFAAAAAHHIKFSSALMAVTKNSAQNNMSTSFQQIAVFTCGQWMPMVKLQGIKPSNRWNKLTSMSLQGPWMEYWHRFSPQKTGTSRQQSPQKLGFLTSLARHPALQRAASSSFHFQLKFRWKKGRDSLELPLVRAKEIVGQNWAKPKRSWGPCWKFHIRLGWCLTSQETELYCSLSGTRSVHDSVSHILRFFNPCKIWGSNGRLDWT